MFAIDLRSFIALGSVMAMLMALVLLLMRVQYPTHIRGLTNWAAAPVLWFIASILFVMRGTLAPWLSIVAANLTIMLGALMFYTGCQRFLGHEPRWRFWLAYMVAAALTLAWLTFQQPNYPARLILFTVLMMGIYGSNLHFLIRHAKQRLPVRLVELLLGLHLLAMLLRLVTAPMDSHSSDGFFNPSWMQALYIGSFSLTALMLSVCAVLLASDRLVTELEHQAAHDPLTQAYNRRALLRLCEEELARSRRNGRGPALLMLDLDHFKQVNDSHGHQHGDAVLVHFANTVQALLRRPDKFGRYGGEEFTLLLPETSAANAACVANRIHAALASGHALDCQVSIGLTVWQGPQDSLDAMLARADRALYQAKAQGRNCTCTA